MKLFKKPLILFLAVCVLLSGISVFSSAAADTTVIKGTFNYDYANSVLTIVNQQREANGMSALVMDKELVDGAMLRAAECKVSFSHTRPNGTSCFTAYKWKNIVGENIAYGQRTPEQVMNSWMNSQGHRENILKASFKKIGVGCFVAENGTLYWAQEFSGGSSSGYSASGSKPVTVNVSLAAGKETTVTYGDTQPTTTAPTTKPTTATNPTVAPTSPTVKPTETPVCTAPKTPEIKSISAKSKKAEIKWSSVSGKTGYQVQYCSNQKFTCLRTTVNTTSTSLKTGKLNYKKVYVRVRAYKRANGKTCYSSWSKVKSKAL